VTANMGNDPRVAQPTQLSLDENTNSLRSVHVTT